MRENHIDDGSRTLSQLSICEIPSKTPPVFESPTTVYYFSRPIDVPLFDRLARVHKKARHAAFIIDDKQRGLTLFEFGTYGLRCKSISHFHITDDNRNLMGHWAYEVGETHLSHAEIVALSQHWVKNHRYVPYDNNCRAFVDHALRKIVGEHGTLYRDNTIDISKNDFKKSPCEAAEKRIRREGFNTSQHVFSKHNSIFSSIFFHHYTSRINDAFFLQLKNNVGNQIGITFPTLPAFPPFPTYAVPTDSVSLSQPHSFGKILSVIQATPDGILVGANRQVSVYLALSGFAHAIEDAVNRLIGYKGAIREINIEGEKFEYRVDVKGNHGKVSVKHVKTGVEHHAHYSTHHSVNDALHHIFTQHLNSLFPTSSEPRFVIETNGEFQLSDNTLNEIVIHKALKDYLLLGHTYDYTTKHKDTGGGKDSAKFRDVKVCDKDSGREFTTGIKLKKEHARDKKNDGVRINAIREVFEKAARQNFHRDKERCEQALYQAIKNNNFEAARKIARDFYAVYKELSILVGSKENVFDAISNYEKHYEYNQMLLCRAEINQLFENHQSQCDEMIAVAKEEVRIHSQKGLAQLQAIVSLCENHVNETKALLQKQSTTEAIAQIDIAGLSENENSLAEIILNNAKKALKIAYCETVYFWIQTAELSVDLSAYAIKKLIAYRHADTYGVITNREVQLQKKIDAFKEPLSVALQILAHHYAWTIARTEKTKSTVSILLNSAQYAFLALKLLRYATNKSAKDLINHYVLPITQLIYSAGSVITTPKNKIASASSLPFESLLKIPRAHQFLLAPNPNDRSAFLRFVCGNILMQLENNKNTLLRCLIQTAEYINVYSDTLGVWLKRPDLFKPVGHIYLLLKALEMLITFYQTHQCLKKDWHDYCKAWQDDQNKHAAPQEELASCQTTLNVIKSANAEATTLLNAVNQKLTLFHADYPVANEIKDVRFSENTGLTHDEQEEIATLVANTTF